MARALAEQVACELIVFGPRPGLSIDPSGLRIRILRPLALLGGHPAHPLVPSLPRYLAGADLVHTHHMRSAPSRVAALAARARGIHTAVTDHGLQGGDWRGLLPRLFERFLAVS